MLLLGLPTEKLSRGAGFAEPPHWTSVSTNQNAAIQRAPKALSGPADVGPATPVLRDNALSSGKPSFKTRVTLRGERRDFPTRGLVLAAGIPNTNLGAMHLLRKTQIAVC